MLVASKTSSVVLIPPAEKVLIFPRLGLRSNTDQNCYVRTDYSLRVQDQTKFIFYIMKVWGAKKEKNAPFYSISSEMIKGRKICCFFNWF
jgi:hypothetical protein